MDLRMLLGRMFIMSMKFVIAVATVLFTCLFSSASWSQSITEDTAIELAAEAESSGPTFEERLELAGNGDVNTQISLARDYLSGENGVPKQPVAAARWLTTASETGNAEAQFLLANLLREGAKGLKANEKNAVTLYASAADKGHIEAAYWAADAYHYGKGVKTADIKAIEYYEKAADLGHVAAQNNLGLMYLQGKGVDRDLKTAFRLFNDTAKSGSSWGLNNLGGMYEMGWGTVKNTIRALELYQKSAAAGNVHGAGNMVRLRAVLEAAARQRAVQQEINDAQFPGTEAETDPAADTSGNN